MEMTEPGIWTYQLTLPSDAYIEYAFHQDGENLLDPFNQRKSSNGMGWFNNYFLMPEYETTNLPQKDKGIPHGIVTSYHVPTDNLIMGENRSVHLYQPPSKEPVPLMVVWDGQDYLNRVHLNNIIDNLIAQKRIQPLALAFVNNGGQKSRSVEYGCSDATLAFLMAEVIPLAVKNLNLIDFNSNPGAYGVAGASMGGLMALYTGARLPQVFGNVLSQSGAFSLAGFDTVVFDLLEHGGFRSLKLWMDVGAYDLPGLLVSNRRMRTLLSQKGYPLLYREYNAGHNYPAWTNEIWRGIEFLYTIK
jgi:enterochelin esterase family protein